MAKTRTDQTTPSWLNKGSTATILGCWPLFLNHCAIMGYSEEYLLDTIGFYWYFNDFDA
jgi:hypothetical protein